MLVNVSEEIGRVDAVVAFHHEPYGKEQHLFHLSALARHLECKGQGLGEVIYAAFMEACESIIDDLPREVVRAVFVAQAHKANRPVQALLDAVGWCRSDEVSEDPNYEWWEQILDLKPSIDAELESDETELENFVGHEEAPAN